MLTSYMILIHLAKGLPSGRRPFTRQLSENRDSNPVSFAQNFDESRGLTLVSERPRFANERVVICAKMPIEPPKSFKKETTFMQGRVSNLTNRLVKRSIQSPNHLSSNHPDANSSSLVPACESASRWVKLTEADDLWGNRVTVLQQFTNGHGIVDQYFFETYCSRPSGYSIARPLSCTGTDTTNFDSYCLEKHVWAYGKVYDQQQRQERWTFIKIRASCNCGVTRKRIRRARSVNPQILPFLE